MSTFYVFQWFSFYIIELHNCFLETEGTPLNGFLHQSRGSVVNLKIQIYYFEALPQLFKFF